MSLGCSTRRTAYGSTPTATCTSAKYSKASACKNSAASASRGTQRAHVVDVVDKETRPPAQKFCDRGAAWLANRGVD